MPRGLFVDPVDYNVYVRAANQRLYAGHGLFEQGALACDAQELFG
jgi:hypothetical protein